MNTNRGKRMRDEKQLLDQLEILLQEAVVKNDFRKIEKIIHQDFTYTDELGTTYNCLSDLQSKREVPKLESLEILNRDVTFFDNVAVVNTHELRKGTLAGKPFEANYFASRIWKKKSGWCLLSVTLSRL